MFPVHCGHIRHIQSCASPVAQGPQAVLPTGALLCYPHTEALLAGTGPRLGEVRRGCESQACKVSRACSHAPRLRSDSPSARGQLRVMGHEETQQERGRCGEELREAHSNQGEEKQARSVIVTEPLNTTYKQARMALGGDGGGSQRPERVRAAQSGLGPGGGSGCRHRRGWAGGGLAACGGLAASPAAPGRSPEDKARVLRTREGWGHALPCPALLTWAPLFPASRSVRGGRRWS